MKTVFISSLLFILCFTSIAQTSPDYYIPSRTKISLKERVSGSVMLGTSLNFQNGHSSAATFIAPKINYSLTKKFSLTAGLIHYSVFPQGIFGTESVITKKQNSSNLLFAGGEYRLNKKVTVAGAVMADMSSVNKHINYKTMEFGMDYKISEHSSIGFRANVSQGSPDYHFDPKRGSYEYRPFSRGLYGDLLGGFGQWGAEELNRSFR
jgi:hypothetical protein